MLWFLYIIKILFPFYHVAISFYIFSTDLFLFLLMYLICISIHVFDMYFYSLFMLYVFFLLMRRNLSHTFYVFYIPLLVAFPSFSASFLEFCFCIWYVFFFISFHIIFLLSVWYVAQILQSTWEPFGDHITCYPGKCLCSRFLVWVSKLGLKRRICLMFSLHMFYDLLMSFNLLFCLLNFAKWYMYFSFSLQQYTMIYYYKIIVCLWTCMPI